MSQLLGDVPFAHLPSQQLLCQRIHSQIRFKSSLVLVGASPGGGKSLIAQELLEQAQFSQHALVSVDADSEDGDFRRALMLQLVAEPLFNQDDPIADSLFRNLDHVDGPQLLVVDNAQNLSADLILELLVLLHSYPTRFSQRLSIVLIGDEEQLFAEAEAVVGQTEIQAIWLSIPPLTAGEVTILARLLFERAGYQAQMENREAIERQLRLARFNPKRVVFFVDQIVNGEVIMSDTPSSKKNLVLLAVAIILIAALAGLLYQMLANTSQLEPQRQAIETIEKDAASNGAPGDTGEKEPVSSPSQAEAEAASETATTELGYGDDNAVLPESGEVKEVRLEDKQEQSGLRIVVQDEVVSRIIEEQNNPQAVETALQTPNTTEESVTAIAETLTETQSAVVSTSELLVSEAKATQTDTTLAVPEEVPEDIKPVVVEEATKPTVVTEPQAIAETTIVSEQKPSATGSSSITHPLMKIDGSRYTLQLIALANEAKAKTFADSQPWAQPVWVYRSNVNPKTPYKVVYGNFDTRQSANDARQRLKNQGIDSLLKQLKQVQFEMQP
ncbi:hypothetical protein DBZ36_01420 [Alginatibacterium sediminis]|uniref:SPOR domain-containing protein n=1 Tax=Alginatibacterium sediminis TaxID=2164068 RepID=A0A420EKU4_9ALTE|nr:AAA family ATPase [Alginatibacterium sediminis]RKF21341.1 hypothetical protein DBZ36_01420 [Alginatibacterium sediminis]